MKRKLCGLLVAGLVLMLLPEHAPAEELAQFNLSLFGYRIGMSFDEASAVRPFARIEDRPGQKGEYCGIIDDLWIDDVEIRLQVWFVDDRIYKVVGKFSPALVEDLVSRLRSVLGKGDDESILLQPPDGGQISNRVQKWRFPGMWVVLIGSSVNTRFATLSLVARPDAGTISPGEEGAS
ncbi:hypothetical protein C2E25_02345 [Geothermobacter hydrogeniphilus]|uniref:Uncharacterized protein n=1 Tax=Geothermobacter hydrogeniphilus TaxID=1969733 RepID=A0A2K2HDQ2_9BACT|nr:hypothetical protein [Geothermobacter hydrogeniphilus]PNU21416.1 hypothetical protein C2E25_02345 [Geothermobacter hydrogeniphilus]